jgi:hypothetical protein
MLIYNQEQHACQPFLQKLWLGFIHVIHDDGERIHILHKNGRRKYYLKVNVLSLDGADSFFHFTTSDKLRPKMSENRGYVYPETGIGKPTQPRTDQVSMALILLRLLNSIVGF